MLSRTESFQIPEKKIRDGEKVIFYGGGEVGKAYLELSTGKRFDVVAMADKMSARTGISTVPVLTPKELAELPRDAYDVILIAIERAEVAQAIRRDLLSLGIPANRILWESPQAKLSASGISVERLVVQLHQQEEHIRALETWRIGIDTFLLDACMERNRTRGGSYQQFIDQLLGAWHVAVSSWNPEWETVMRHYPSLFAKAPEMLPPASDWQEVDACILWGTQFAIEKNREFLRTALLQRKEIVGAALGFLNRVAWPGPEDGVRQAEKPNSLEITVHELYDCTSKLRMEALILKKPVHVFGMPFYAGWGLTDDYMTCPRRTHHRSLEELFYVTYIRYSWYVDPRTGRPCEIEDAMDYLLQMREAYFSRS